jgi:subtilisin family serine protease
MPVASPAADAGVESSDAVPARYIVVLKKGAAKAAIAGESVPEVANAMAARHSRKVVHTYQHALEGFSVDMTAGEAAALKTDERVAYIEQDQGASFGATQTGATWGLDRIDQRQLPLSTTYTYPDQGGAGVHVYIVDSGLNPTTREFGGRVVNGPDFVDNDGNPDDCMGHGTHVAGIIGSATYGVAKAATLHPIRIGDCVGNVDWSNVIKAIDWVTANHIDPAVANLSLQGPVMRSVNEAVANSIAHGITYVVCAGNFYMDACQVSPASTPEAITVGATDSSDRKADFSDYGTCVDLFGPGVDILSTYLNGTTRLMSGCSMATPHAVGVAALYLGQRPSATPAEVAAALTAQATQNVVTDPGTGSPNLLLYSAFTNSLSKPCDGICSNPTRFTINGSYQSGAIGTGAGCLETYSPIHGGNCGNFVSPRQLSVNGAQRTCNGQNWSSVPAARNGGYCIKTTAGNYSWAYITAW